MAHLDEEPTSGGGAAQRLRLRHGLRDRLFHKDVFPPLQSFQGDGVMRVGARGDSDGIDRIQQRIDVSRGQRAVLARDSLRPFPIGVKDARQVHARHIGEHFRMQRSEMSHAYDANPQGVHMCS